MRTSTMIALIVLSLVGLAAFVYFLPSLLLMVGVKPELKSYVGVAIMLLLIYSLIDIDWLLKHLKK